MGINKISNLFTNLLPRAFPLGQKPGIALGFQFKRWWCWVLLLVASPAEFNGQGAVRDAVVGVLGCRWPLSLKAIYFTVTKEYALSVSYQAVHKALKQLVQKGVVVKENMEYSLSIDWIRNTKCFAANLEQAYSGERMECSNSVAKTIAESKPAAIAVAS